MRSMPEFEHLSWLTAIHGLAVYKLFHERGINLKSTIYREIDMGAGIEELLEEGFSSLYNDLTILSEYEDNLKEHEALLELFKDDGWPEFVWVIEDERFRCHFDLDRHLVSLPLHVSDSGHFGFEDVDIDLLQSYDAEKAGVVIYFCYNFGGYETVQAVLELEDKIKELNKERTN